MEGERRPDVVDQLRGGTLVVDQDVVEGSARGGLAGAEEVGEQFADDWVLQDLVRPDVACVERGRVQQGESADPLGVTLSEGERPAAAPGVAGQRGARHADRVHEGADRPGHGGQVPVKVPVMQLHVALPGQVDDVHAVVARQHRQLLLPADHPGGARRQQHYRRAAAGVQVVEAGDGRVNKARRDRVGVVRLVAAAGLGGQVAVGTVQHGAGQQREDGDQHHRQAPPSAWTRWLWRGWRGPGRCRCRVLPHGVSLVREQAVPSSDKEERGPAEVP